MEIGDKLRVPIAALLDPLTGRIVTLFFEDGETITARIVDINISDAEVVVVPSDLKE